MVDFRRSKIDSPDAIYFLTLVTHQRRHVFLNREDFVLVWRVMDRVAKRFDASYPAWVILPNHLHWVLQPGHSDYSRIVFSFKRAVGFELKKQNRIRQGQKLWQDRFWEHTIRDEKDLGRCVDYIHYNPVKHGLVGSTADWPYSSFRTFVGKGVYSPDWGDGDELKIPGSEWDL
ncbi:MAG: transposase [Candidatus Omnitrophica bacterium]|nr:transposase [Candidatus Omnitrophota bacterium]